MMTMTDRNDNLNGATFAFKVLSGALNGIEFSLGTQDHFICVNEDAAKQANLSFAERTLFIPVAKPGNNFILSLGNQTGTDQFGVTICFETHQETQQLTFNAVHQIEGLAFAVKSADDIWSDDVLKGLPPPATLHIAEEVPTQAVSAASSKFKKLKSSAGTIGAAVILCSFVFFGWQFSQSNLLFNAVTPNGVIKMNEIMGNRAGNSVHMGSDKIHYLFASNSQQFELANQIIHRNNLGQEWKVVTPQSEEARVTNVLERNNVAFFTIRFTDPVNPTLLLSSNRNEISEANLSSITKLMLAAMPYASNVHIVLEEDSEVLNRAQQGLRALGFNYETVQSDSGVTLSSWLPSVDVHLSEFSRFVTQFYQTWGRRYVHFSADIHEDMLKEKSYKYGEDGYITMNKSHWMFNKKMD